MWIAFSRGLSPPDLPVQKPTKFKFVIDLKAEGARPGCAIDAARASQPWRKVAIYMVQVVPSDRVDLQ
jgi:hypothetical protein